MNSQRQYTGRRVSQEDVLEASLMCADAPFTQSKAYTRAQQAVGRNVVSYVVENESAQVVAQATFVVFELPFKKVVWYAPFGPVAREWNAEIEQALIIAVEHDARKAGAMFVRFDVWIGARAAAVRFSRRLRLPARATLHTSFMQPRIEWYIPLAKSEDEIFADMHKNTRYSIRQSEKFGVQTKIVTENLAANLDVFYELMAETAERDHFSLHPKSYYKTVFETYEGSGGMLVIVAHEDTILTINFVVVYGNTATHVFGGSRSVSRNLMPAYAAHKAAISHLKTLNLEYFNLGGVNGHNGETNASWAGITLFKRRFGGFEVTHNACSDLVLQPFWYALFKLYKRFR